MANKERLTQTLIDLIRIDSPTGEEDNIDSEVSRRLTNLGFTVKHDSFNNVIATLPGVGDPVLLSAHLDTVEPGRGIIPIIEGDLLKSDGTTILGGDCKAGLTIILEALESVIQAGLQHLPVEVVFTRAEEGGLVGVHNLDFGLVTATRAVVMDGEGTIDRLTLSAPSQNIVSINIQGRASHAGLEPENGLSALVLAGQVLTRLPLGRIDEETTSNIGRAEGGLKRNIIPESAYLDGEIRSRNNNKLEEISQTFLNTCKEVETEFTGSKISVEIRNSYKAYDINPDDSAVKMVSSALDKLGLVPEYAKSGGGSDANVFNETGITAIPLGIGVQSFHTKIETAILSEVWKGAQVCEHIITGN